MKIELNTKGIVELDKNNKEQIMELMQYLRDMRETAWIQYETTNKSSYWDLFKNTYDDIFKLMQYFKEIWLEVINLNPKRRYV